VRGALHISDKTFLLAELLKTSYHLLNRFTCTRLHFQHKKRPSLLRLTKKYQEETSTSLFVKIQKAIYCNGWFTFYQVKNTICNQFSALNRFWDPKNAGFQPKNVESTKHLGSVEKFG
jgi:hypothetical protein